MWQAAQAAEGEFRRTQNLDALGESIRQWEMLAADPALGRAPLHLRAALLNGRNRVLTERFRRVFDRDDLERAIKSWSELVEAIEAADQATGLENPYRSVYWGNLGAALHARFEIEPEVQILDRAIELLELACLSPPEGGIPGLDSYRLSEALVARHQHLQRAEAPDVERAVESARRAIEANDTHESRARFLAQLGTALLLRYRARGQSGDLAEGLSKLELSLQEVSPEAPAFRVWASELGRGYTERFLVRGDLADLRCALALLEAAASHRHQGPSLASCLSNLGVARCLWFDFTRNPDHLELGLRALGESIKVTLESGAGTAGLAHYIQALAFGLTRRPPNGGGGSPSGKVIELLEAILPALSAESPISPLVHATLSHAYATSHRASPDPSRIEKSLAHALTALDRLPEKSPERYSIAWLAAEGLRAKFELGGDPNVLEKAVQGFRLSCDLLLERTPARAIESALAWADRAFGREAWSEAREAYARVFAGLAMVLDPQLVRSARESWLSRIQGLASRAAYAAARDDDSELAVLALEQGHARLLADRQRWTEAANGTLKQLHPRLWQRYRIAVDKALELERQLLDAPLPLPGFFSMQTDPEKRLRKQRQRVLEQILAIRELDGFGSFALPIGLPEVQRALGIVASAEGRTLLVYLVMTPAGSLLLWLDGEETGTLWLDSTLDDLQRWLIDSTDGCQRFNAPPPETLRSIGRHIATPLDALVRTREMERVILIPSGPLGTLPIHASPIAHDVDNEQGERAESCLAFDHIVSFQPNGASVAAAAQTSLAADARRASQHRVLLVGEKGLASWLRQLGPVPSSPGIDCTKLDLAAGRLRERVLAEMADATHVHFGCHARFDLGKPFDSWLDLGDGERLTLDDLLNNAVWRQPPELVVLAACESAARDRARLPDEWISLAGAFLHQGVRGVLATLWPVDDTATALLMSRFYELLFGAAQPPASALAEAQKWLRNLTMADLAGAAQESPEPAMKSWAARAIANHGLGHDRPFREPRFWAGFLLIGNP